MQLGAELEVLVLWTPARRGCGTNRSEPQPRRDDAPTKATNGAPCPDIKVRGQVVKPRIRRKGDYACFRQVTVVCPCPRPIGRVATQARFWLEWGCSHVTDLVPQTN